MSPVEAIISDGPLEGEHGLTVEEPTGQGPWPVAAWQDEAGERHRYVFKEMSIGPTTLPVYAYSPLTQ